MSSRADGRFVPGPSWLAIIFNPSFPYRLAHTVIASYLTTALGGRRGRRLAPASRQAPTEHARKMFSMAMWMAALATPVQIFVGDQHGLNTFKHQPAKVMAMEGHYESHADGAPFYICRLARTIASSGSTMRVGIPKLGSLLLVHRPDAPLAGLDTVPDEDQPPAAVIFWSFRIMVGIGLLMLGLGLWSLWARLQAAPLRLARAAPRRR